MKEIENLIKKMREGIVSFSFQKKDGSIRHAKGTLKSDMCPPILGTGRHLPDHLQIYFDVEKKSYRSFYKEKFIGLD